MENLDYTMAAYWSAWISILDDKGETIECCTLNALNQSINNDINAYLVHLIEVEKKPIRLEGFCFSIGVFDCYDGDVLIGETKVGEYCVETLEEKSTEFAYFNRCSNCSGEGYTEEVKCPVYSGSDCCGGCYVPVPCNCEEHKLFTDY
jgi:hypothetical protein